MKYKAIIETDDFEDFKFFEDGCGKYMRGIDAGSVNGEWIALYFTECEQEPKTGHWIDREVYDTDRWKCSECGRTEPYKENYCPSCGSYNGGGVNSMIVCKCGCYMIWKIAYKYGVSITWWECPNCGNNTRYSYTWSDRTESIGLRGKQHG